MYRNRPSIVIYPLLFWGTTSESPTTPGMHFKHQLFPAGKNTIGNIYPRAVITNCRISRSSSTVLYAFFLPGVLKMNPGSLMTCARKETTCCHIVGYVNAGYFPRTAHR